MKTLSTVLSFIMIISLILTGCSTESETHSKSITAEISKTVSDGDAVTDSTNDNHTSFQDKTAKSEAIVQVCQENFEGVYKKSTIPTTRPTQQVDIYEYNDGEFRLDHNTGELIGFSSPHSPCGAVTEGVKAEYDLDSGRKIAYDLAKQYLGNIEDYTVTEENRESSLAYRFNRYVDGIETSEFMNISVCPFHGEILYFYMGELGSFSNENMRNRSADIKALKEASTKLIEENIKSEFAAEKYYDGYEVKNETLIKLTDGEYGILYTVSVNYRQPLEDGTFAVGGELVCVTVKFDK